MLQRFDETIHHLQASTPTPFPLPIMDCDPPPPPYSLRISRAVVLDQEGSLVKGIDEISSSMREISSAFDTVMVTIRLYHDLETSSLGPFLECKEMWRRYVHTVIDTALDLKVQILDQFSLVVNRTDQTSLEALKQILIYINSRVPIERKENEATDLILKLDFTIATLRPECHPNSCSDTISTSNKGFKNAIRTNSVMLSTIGVLQALYIVTSRYYPSFPYKLDSYKVSFTVHTVKAFR